LTTMKIDLHIHSRASDGRMSPEEIFQEASRRNVGLISITDHDSTDAQEAAREAADKYGIRYLCGIELNVTFGHPGFKEGKAVSLDFLGYDYDIHYGPLAGKLKALRDYRKKRAEKILEKINAELVREHLPRFTRRDLEEIQDSVDGTFGRPHIADYMVKKGIAGSRQVAFDRYLVKCNVPKMPLPLSEASALIRGGGGKLVFAHPNHPRGTSLIKLTHSLDEQQRIIRESMLPYIDGIECWHSGHDAETTRSYLDFAAELGLMVTGGSDCHQQPVLIGSVDVPPYVAEQFGFSVQ
jgi:predicted metal-dependent phosphoesterase TrpH